MVRITNGKDILEVTTGAFHEFYAKQGFNVVESHKKEVKPIKEETKPEAQNPDEAFIKNISEKPLSKWSPKELKKFADIKKIDLTNTKSAEEAREIIKEYL